MDGQIIANIIHLIKIIKKAKDLLMLVLMFFLILFTVLETEGQLKSTNKTCEGYFNEVSLPAKRFVVENIIVIDYRDLAKLTNIKQEIIKKYLL